MRVLVLNPGSSSLKSSVVETAAIHRGRPVDPLAGINVDWGVDATATTGAAGPADEIRRLLARYEEAGIETASLGAVGYRVVHGGTRFRLPTLLTPAVVGELDALRDLAPLHNGVAVATIRAGLTAAPQLPHVAVFDTAFHSTLPEEGFRYPVPERWYREWGIRRYGFHGMSVAWAAERAAVLLAGETVRAERAAAERVAAERVAAGPAETVRAAAGPAETVRAEPAAVRSAHATAGPEAGTPAGASASDATARPNVVVAHLGSGCSVTAVSEGRSVSTSMGLTPLEGLMMGTRSGSIDPGIIFALLRDGRLSADELADQLDHASGLVGVSGRTSDVRELLAMEAKGDEPATLALALFVRRAAESIAAAATSLPSLDAIVFTGGIGENAAGIRARIATRLGSIGVRPVEDRPVQDDAVLSVEGIRPAVLRIEAREDLIVAREAAGAVEAAG
jgi:acetate kinase